MQVSSVRETITLAQGCPKAELHVHLEGTLEPEMMLSLALRNGVALRSMDVEDIRAAYDFADLQSFLDIYYEGMSVLLTAEDFRDLTLAYLGRAASDNVVHVEPFFDPQAHTARGVPFETVLAGITAGLEEGQRRLGITSRLIMCILRHLSAEEGMAALEEMLPFRDAITALGLDSTEVGHVPDKFADVFARARAEGLIAVAHVGEEGTATDVAITLDVLGVSRIDHGVHAMDDPDVVARLVRDRIPLTVCPLSNVKLRVFDTMASHNLREMLEAGVVATVNSDDPAYFGGYINDNFAAAIEALRLTPSHIRQLAINSFEASFLTPAEKTARIGEVEAHFRGTPVVA